MLLHTVLQEFANKQNGRYFCKEDASSWYSVDHAQSVASWRLLRIALYCTCWVDLSEGCMMSAGLPSSYCGQRCREMARRDDNT